MPGDLVAKVAVVRVALRTLERFSEDDAWVLSGYIAFAVLMAIFPFLIFATALAGLIVGPEEGAAAVEYLVDLAPDNIAAPLEPVLADVLGEDRGGILTVSALGAIWAASNGVEAFRTAFDKAYDITAPRGFVLRRCVAIGFVFAGAATFAALALLVVLAPLLARAAEELAGVIIPYSLMLARYGVALLVFAVFLYLLHRGLPSQPLRSKRIWPGILVTILLWMGAATGFSVYLRYAPDYSVTYGGLSGVIVTLLFFYITGAVIILGAELNQTLAEDE